MMAAVIAGHGRGMRPPGLVHHGADAKAGEKGAVGVAGDHLTPDDFLSDDDDVAGGLGGSTLLMPVLPHR
jgi:hypothetical protein